jgi:hypothetical protein
MPTLHKSQVSGLAIASNGSLASVGWDDTVAFTQGAFDAIGPAFLSAYR